MKVDLERMDGEPEKYRVRAEGIPESMGIVSRTGSASWEFAPRAADDDAPDDAMTIVLTAKDAGELKAVIEKRFGTLDAALERLNDSTLEQFATRVLLPISSLATQTKSIGGMVNALGHQVAVIAAHDIVPTKREEFFARFLDRVRDETAAIVREREGREAWEKTMRGFVEGVAAETQKKGGDDGPTKH